MLTVIVQVLFADCTPTQCSSQPNRIFSATDERAACFRKLFQNNELNMMQVGQGHSSHVSLHARCYILKQNSNHITVTALLLENCNTHTNTCTCCLHCNLQTRLSFGVSVVLSVSRAVFLLLLHFYLICSFIFMFFILCGEHFVTVCKFYLLTYAYCIDTYIRKKNIFKANKRQKLNCFRQHEHVAFMKREMRCFVYVQVHICKKHLV